MRLSIIHFAVEEKWFYFAGGVVTGGVGGGRLGRGVAARGEGVQAEFVADGAVGGIDGGVFQVGGVWTIDRSNLQGDLEVTIDFGAVLDAVNANELFGWINPVENTVVADAELAESRQIFRHADEPAMHHAGGIGGEPLYLALDGRADGGVQPGKLGIGLAAYFDLVGHGR